MSGVGRQSNFAGGASQSDAAIAEVCVHSTLDCINVLDDALTDMEEQNRELQRIANAVTYNRMYVLLPERRIREASIQQSSEIEPQITELLQLAEKSVKNLERKESMLKQKVEAQKNLKADPQKMIPQPLSAAANERDERQRKHLIRQRQVFERELAALEKECRDLQRQLDG